MTRSDNKRSGFSLMELLAVVTILGIIAAIIVPRL
jgi:prepilin-type N-terminal cleavage/methylation domain-containing protein